MADNEDGDNLSYSDQKRRIFLVVATLLLIAAMCVALVLKTTLFTAISAFLLPAIECLLALIFVNQVRSSKTFQIFALALSIVTTALAFSAAPLELFMAICFVNIVWGGLFQLGLDLASSPVQIFPYLYCVISLIFIPMVWPLAFPVPVFLTAAMIVLKNCSADAELQADAAGGEREVCE